MSELRSGFVTWWKLRRRFAEEWAFHRDATVAEFESMGYGRWSARQAARQRMGARGRHRSEALAAIGGDIPGLWRLLPVRSASRSALFVPVILVVGVALALIVNPARNAAVRCIRAMLFGGTMPAAERLIPLTPPGLVPVSLAGALLRLLAVAAAGWAVAKLAPRGSFRALLYSVTVLCAIVLASAVVWVTGLQILVSKSWGYDGIQGSVLLTFFLSFVGMLYLAMLLWWIDVESRCPCCLRLPGMPEMHGHPYDVLVNPLAIESICFHGHGVAVQSRWGRCFLADPGGVL